MPAASQQLQLKATYKPTAKLQVFYTGGGARLTKDGKLLACSCSDEVKIMEFSTGAVLRSIKPDGEAVTALAVSPDCRTLIVATRSLYVRVYDMTTGGQLRSWRGHKGPIADLAIDASGGYVATASADRSVKVWDIAGGFCTHHFPGGHGGVVLRALFHPKNLQLFTAGDDGSVRVWDLVEKNCTYDLKAHFSAVTSLALSPDGWLLLTGGRDKVVVVWDLRSGNKLATVPIFEAVEGLVALPLGAPFPGVTNVAADTAAIITGAKKLVFFATAGEKGAIKFWRSDTGACVREVAPEVAVAGSAACEITELALLPMAAAGVAAVAGGGTALGPGLLAATADARLLFYTPQEVGGSLQLKLSRQLVGNQDQVTDLRFVGPPTEPSMLAVATNSETVRLYGISNMSCTVSLVGHRDTVLCLDGGMATGAVPALLASGGKDQEVRLWEAASGRCLGLGVGHVGAINGVALSKKSHSFLVSVGADKLIKLWDIASAVALLTNSTEGVAATVNENGKTSSEGVTSTVVAASGPLQLRTIAAVAGHDKDINAVAVAPNDKLVATASQDKTVRVWSLPDLVQVSILRGHKRGVWAVEFAPLERALLTASGDKTLKIWSLADCSCLRTFEGHTASVLRATFVTAGTQVLSGGADGLLKMWNVASGECVNTFDEHEDKVWALATGGSAEGLVATGGGDALVCMWADSTEADAIAAAAADEELAEKEQDLQNALADADFVKAAHLAFSLKHPGRLLSIISRAATAAANTVVDSDITDPEVNPSSKAAAVMAAGPLGRLLSGLVGVMSEEDLRTSLEYVRDWNTNAKHCHAAQALLGAILRTHGPDKLLRVPGLVELLAQVSAYSGRHFSRLDRLVRSTYLLDFTLESMGVLGVGTGIGAGLVGELDETDGEDGVVRMVEADEEGMLLSRLAAAAKVARVTAGHKRRRDEEANSEDLEGDVAMVDAARSGNAGAHSEDESEEECKRSEGSVSLDGEGDSEVSVSDDDEVGSGVLEEEGSEGEEDVQVQPASSKAATAPAAAAAAATDKNPVPNTVVTGEMHRGPSADDLEDDFELEHGTTESGDDEGTGVDVREDGEELLVASVDERSERGGDVGTAKGTMEEKSKEVCAGGNTSDSGDEAAMTGGTLTTGKDDVEEEEKEKELRKTVAIMVAGSRRKSTAADSAEGTPHPEQTGKGDLRRGTKLSMSATPVPAAVTASTVGAAGQKAVRPPATAPSKGLKSRPPAIGRMVASSLTAKQAAAGKVVAGRARANSAGPKPAVPKAGGIGKAAMPVVHSLGRIARALDLPPPPQGAGRDVAGAAGKRVAAKASEPTSRKADAKAVVKQLMLKPPRKGTELENGHAGTEQQGQQRQQSRGGNGGRKGASAPTTPVESVKAKSAARHGVRPAVGSLTGPAKKARRA